jgi:uncharacterized protein
MPIYQWDQDKRALNIADHRIDFTAAENFDWDTAFIEIDDRDDYGELREVAWGFIGVGLHVMVFTRRGDAVRIISLRRGQKRDVRKYAENFKKGMA